MFMCPFFSVFFSAIIKKVDLNQIIFGGKKENQTISLNHKLLDNVIIVFKMDCKIHSMFLIVTREFRLSPREQKSVYIYIYLFFFFLKKSILIVYDYMPHFIKKMPYCDICFFVFINY